MSAQRDRQQGPPDLPVAEDALRQAVSDSFIKGVGKATGGESPHGRPHQIDAVTALVRAVRHDCQQPTATNYLLQHSAGSGKSLTIAALVTALLRTVDEAGRSFHSVLVVNDRLQLDQQLGDTVSSFIAGNGFPSRTVARANSSSQLRSFLLAPASDPRRPTVILTTIQKLGSLWRNTNSKAWKRARKQSGTSKPWTNQQDPADPDHAATDPDPDQAASIDHKTLGAGSINQIQGDNAGSNSRSLADVQSDARSDLIRVLAQGRVAIIADEAHRHHGNSTAQQISAILTAAFGLGAGTTAAGSRKRKLGGAAADQGDAAMQQQQQQQQPRFVTYFGFTATPGPRALQLFGVAQQVQVDILGTVLPDHAAAAVSKTAEAAVKAAVPPVQQQNLHQQKWQGLQVNGRFNSHSMAAKAQPQDTQQQHQQQYVAPATLYSPFHSYTLQRATSDGFVLDVLQRFVSVTPRIQIAGLQLTEQQQQQLLKLDQANRVGMGSSSSSSAGKSLRSDLFGPTAAAAAAAAARSAAGISNPGAGLHNPSGPSLAEELLVQAASNSRQLVAVKAEAVVDRFISAWSEAAACGFVGFRAMLVVRSRQHVMWYVQEVRRLLQQHSQQAAELLRQAGEPVDLRSASSIVRGDTAPLCYGAYSGSVAITAAEAHKLWDSSSSNSTREGQTAAVTNGAAVDVAGAGDCAAKSAAAAAAADTWQPPDATAAAVAGKVQKSDIDSDRDASSAGFAVQKQQQQQQQQQQCVNGLPPDAAASSADVNQEDSSWFLRSSRPSSAAQQQTGGSSSSSDASKSEVRDEVNGNTAMDTGSDSGSEYLAASSSSSSSESESDSNEDEQDHDHVAAAAAAAATGSSRRKKVRRDSSTLSCSTANTAAAEHGEDLDCDLESADLRSSDPEDDLPLSARLQQQEQLPNLPAAAAAMDLGDQGCDLVFVSERDLNPSGFGPADARLLVVCSKFETGYDDPRLGAMFVDRSLSGARAVQVLGRINRPAPGKGLLPTHRPDTATNNHTDSSHQHTQHTQQHTAAVAAGNEQLLVSSIDRGVKQDPDDQRTVDYQAAAAGGVAGGAANSEGGSESSTIINQSIAAAKPPPPPPPPAAATAAAAAAADEEGGHRAGFRVVVVDFVNSVGAIKEAFREFYGTTTSCTGSQAKRRRQHQALDDSLTRVLELLQPAAARQATRNKLLLKQQQQQQQGNGTAASSSGGSNSSLADLNVDQMVGLVGGLAPETQRRVEEDLSQYCTCCTRLRVEKLEFPYIFAQALLAQLTARRQRREKAASSGRFAWMEQLHTVVAAEAAAAAAAAAANADKDDQHDGDGDGDIDHQQQQEAAAAAGEAGEDEDNDSNSKQPAAASKLRQKLNVSVRVCELETTFAGAVKLSASDQPLRSVKLSSHLSAAVAAARSGSSTAAAAAANPGKQVGSGRPLLEVIAAANAQLAGRFRKQVVEGLRELIERLKGAEGRLAAVERFRQAQRAAAAAPAAAAAVRVEVLRDRQQDQQQQGPAAAAAGAESNQSQQQQESDSAAEGEVGEDVYKILTLLRRLQLWPVTVELLKTTSAGKQVSALRNHQHPQVSQLATEVVQQWKAQLAVQAAAAAAAAAKKVQQEQSGAAAAGSKAAGKNVGQSSPTAAAAAIDQDLRRKVNNLMRDAFVDHRQKVLAQQQQKHSERSINTGSSEDNDRISLSAEEMSRLRHLAEVLEQELYQYITNQTSNHPKATQTPAAAAAAGSGSSSRTSNMAQDYKSRARMLCTAIRDVDGVALDLISGAKIASEVVGLDALSLAPAAAQQAIRKRHEDQCRAEEHWESLVQGTVGGGGTFVTTEVSCPQCGKNRAQVHDILSGGSYAQERVPIQKYVCQECLHTWRNE